ncbi:hypothetical protein, partial [Escherichia coli]|uniref:hypothetical protein n=1 Tax=Escherichia coli TaxID=562 RepID=UPI00406947D0
FFSNKTRKRDLTPDLSYLESSLSPPVWSTFGGRKKVAIGACMQESAILAFPSHSMLSKR